MDVELFGRSYAAPFGVAPMGMPGIVWPGAENCLAKAAQRHVSLHGRNGGEFDRRRTRASLPAICCGSSSIASRNDHALGFDLVRRADPPARMCWCMTHGRPGAHETAARGVARAGAKFSPDLRTIVDMLRSPGWLMALRTRPSALFQLQALCGQCEPEDVSISPAAIWAARVHLGRGRPLPRSLERPLVLKGSCIRRTPRGRCRSASTASGFEPRRPPDRRRYRRLIDVLPAIAAQVDESDDPPIRHRRAQRYRTWCGRLPWARRPPLPAKPSSGASARCGRAGPRHVIELLIDETRAAPVRSVCSRPARPVRW